jgi:hypothetical protein
MISEGLPEQIVECAFPPNQKPILPSPPEKRRILVFVLT